MSIDLILKPLCDGCGSKDELYGSTCKHLTLCKTCGKSMAQKRSKCYECGTSITRLIREYNVRGSSSNDKNYFIASFRAGLPNFKKKNVNKWSLQKEGLLGRQVTDTLRDKLKNKPWLLEDETGQFQYLGLLQGTQAPTYYLLMLEGKDFVASPAASWYNFNKVAQYKQLTIEEAEAKMKNRKETVDERQKWMMKAAHSGAAAFGEVEKFDDREGAGGGGGGKGGKEATRDDDDDDEANVSDRGDEDEEEESARKNRLGLNKKSGDDDEEDPRGGDLDFDEDDIEKGDDWEYEEIFTDDDAEIDGDDREDLDTEIHAPPEIKQDDEDEDEADEEQGEGGLSKSGKELNKLLKRTKGLNDSDAEDDSDDDDTEDDISPLLAPKKEAPKEEPVDNSSPLKAKTSTTGRGTPSTSKSAKEKRKSSGEESKTPNGAPLKKVKTEHESKHVESAAPSKSIAPPKGATPSASSRSVPAPATGPVTEDEIRAVLLQKKPVTTQDLVAKFKSRLKSKEDKDGFAAILRRISKIQKTNGANFVVLRER